FVSHPTTTEIYPLSLHDALPISLVERELEGRPSMLTMRELAPAKGDDAGPVVTVTDGRATVRYRAVAARLEDATTFFPVLDEDRSEEHTSELQSLAYLVCRLLLE